MGITFFYEWEIALMVWLQAHLSPLAQKLMGVFTMFGEELIMVAVLGFLYWCWDKDLGRFVGTNIMASVILNPLVKNIIPRRRPYYDTPAIRCLKAVDADADIYDIAAQGFSFPSGHAMNAASLYGSLALGAKKKWLAVVAVALPLLIGISRVALGVHYPTDVLVGWAAGVAVMLLTARLQTVIKDRRVLYLILVIVALPGWFYCTTSDYYSGFGLMVGFFAADLFEQRYVHFENTRSPVRIVLRLIGGFIIFLGLNTALKLPFSAAFLAGGTFAARFVRAARYAVVAFADMALYPMLFKATAHVGRKEKKA